MRKMFILALCVAFTTVAQAVTVTWSLTGDDVYVTGTKFRENSQGTAFSLALTYTLQTAPAENTIIASIGQWNAGQSNVKALSSGGVRVDKTGSGGSQGYSVDTNMVGEKVSVVFTWSYPSATGNPTISAYINGTKCYTFTCNTNANNLNLTVTKSDLWEVHDVTAYEGILSADMIDYLNTEKTSVLPEPTALALLAIGVAGLVLRRSVA